MCKKRNLNFAFLKNTDHSTKFKRISRICSDVSLETLSTEYQMHVPSFFSIATDLNPCLNVHCPRFGVCKTYSAHDARCECFDQCPSYQDPVCTANGTTYDNKCWHELSYCRGLENNLVYHPGSCEGKAKTLQ